MPKKQLTDADYALLAKRGVNKLTTVTDFEIPKSTPKKNKHKTKKINPNANHPLVGKILHTSWGYDMTINDFCKIIEVSKTGKTVKCQMVHTVGFDGFASKVNAGDETYGEIFRLKVGTCLERPSFHGSYPYSGSSKHMGYFSIHDGREVWENHMD